MQREHLGKIAVPPTIKCQLETSMAETSKSTTKEKAAKLAFEPSALVAPSMSGAICVRYSSIARKARCGRRDEGSHCGGAGLGQSEVLG
jgi:hypothetical protein